MGQVFTKEYEVRAYEADFEGRAHALTLFGFLQDAAGAHARENRFSVTDLFERGLTWVLSRYHVRISAYPRWGERVRLDTWGSGRHGFFALRDFRMTGPAGDEVLVGTSSWMVLDLATKAPVRIEGLLPADYIREDRALPDAFPTLPVPAAPTLERPFRVEARDLDLNKHVNNAVYIRWALETVPPDVLLARRPRSVEVSYRAEAFYGDEITSRAEPFDAGPGEAGFVHQLANRATGVELTRLRTAWA